MSGHMVYFANSSSQCGGVDVRDAYTDSQLTEMGITITGESADQKIQTLVAARLFGAKLLGATWATSLGGAVIDAYKKAVGSTDLIVLNDDIPTSGNCATIGGTVTCHHAPGIANTIHEMFHVFDNHYRDLSTTDDGKCGGGAGCWASNYLPQEYINDVSGYQCAKVRCIAHPPSYGGYDSSEAFANLGQNWVLDATNVDVGNSGFKGDFGDTLRNWMNTNMPTFLKNMGY